ncbi:MAG: HPr family phosphocarrier protein [Treponema sp.]|jgi:phosphotransferase system HPr (HPr) family protein|nr:HPr family phosphocarrier protein [Treponema sp.]
MKEFSYRIKDLLGIHARPAGLFVKKMQEYASVVTITRGTDICDGKKLLALMRMRVRHGETITIKAAGLDEEAIIEAAKVFLSGNL